MKILLTKVILTATLCLGVETVAHGEESPCSINLTGYSWHENEKQRAEANQINPGIGVRCDLSESWYVEFDYVLRNSVRGKTYTLGLGWHTKIPNQDVDHPIHIGVQAMYMQYESPDKGTLSGYVPAFTLEYRLAKTNNVTVTAVVYIFPMPDKSVVFTGLNLRF
jgi:hypothetical protein